MRLLINHQSIYRYQEMVRHSVQYLRMTPQTLGHQRVINWALATPGIALEQRDGFSNVWTSLTINYPHDSATIMAQGCVELDPAAESIRDDRIPHYLFCYPTAMTTIHESMRDFAAPYLTRRAGLPNREDLIALAQALIERMPYTPGLTDVDTTAINAFDLGLGVCQDHTHVFLACVRDVGLPARYVSGYFYTRSQEHLSSHAWAEVRLDDHWYCFDISNQLFTHSQHVQVAIGRDYLDTAPIRGVRIGGGSETAQALVQVLPA